MRPQGSQGAKRKILNQFRRMRAIDRGDAIGRAAGSRKCAPRAAAAVRDRIGRPSRDPEGWVEHRRSPRRAREATLRDVAAAAGVSIWTASNTYGNPARVSEATRERVLAAARELGYAGPHPGARSLARGRTGMIAVVAPGDADLLLTDPAAALVTRGLLTACSWAGYPLVLSGASSAPIADGRVFFRVVPETGARVPGVVVNGPAAPGAEHAVRADVRGAAAALAAHLYDLGHRELAVLSWPGAEDRLAGVEDGWRGAPLRGYRVEARPDGPASATTAGRDAPPARRWPGRHWRGTPHHGGARAGRHAGAERAGGRPLDGPAGARRRLGRRPRRPPGSDAAGLTTALVPTARWASAPATP